MGSHILLLSTAGVMILVCPLRADDIAIKKAIAISVGSSWKHGDRYSSEAEPGKDGPGRLHVKVKNGDRVFFSAGVDLTEVIFENGQVEAGKVWQVVELRYGSCKTAKRVEPLRAEDKRRKYYVNPESVRVATRPPLPSPPAPCDLIVVIQIKNLTANQAILFASGTSHENKQMFGALILDKD